jgi:hypothetical protein
MNVSSHISDSDSHTQSLDFQEEAVARLELFPEVYAAIKRASAPNGILSPGHYGIG